MMDKNTREIEKILRLIRISKIRTEREFQVVKKRYEKKMSRLRMLEGLHNEILENLALHDNEPKSLKKLRILRKIMEEGPDSPTAERLGWMPTAFANHPAFFEKWGSGNQDSLLKALHTLLEELEQEEDPSPSPSSDTP